MVIAARWRIPKRNAWRKEIPRGRRIPEEGYAQRIPERNAWRKEIPRGRRCPEDSREKSVKEGDAQRREVTWEDSQRKEIRRGGRCPGRIPEGNAHRGWRSREERDDSREEGDDSQRTDMPGFPRGMPGKRGFLEGGYSLGRGRCPEEEDVRRKRMPGGRGCPEDEDSQEEEDARRKRMPGRYVSKPQRSGSGSDPQRRSGCEWNKSLLPVVPVRDGRPFNPSTTTHTSRFNDAKRTSCFNELRLGAYSWACFRQVKYTRQFSPRPIRGFMAIILPFLGP